MSRPSAVGLARSGCSSPLAVGGNSEGCCAASSNRGSGHSHRNRRRRCNLWIVKVTADSSAFSRSSWRAPTQRVAGIDLFLPPAGRAPLDTESTGHSISLSIPNLYKINPNRHRLLVSNKRKFDIFGRRDEDNRYLFCCFLLYQPQARCLDLER